MVGSVPRKHRGSEVQSERPDRLEQSRSVYLVAATPAFAILAGGLLFFSAGVMALAPGAAGTIFSLLIGVLALGCLGVLAALPVGVRSDAKLVASLTGWTPDRDRFVRKSQAGLATFLVVSVVGTVSGGLLEGIFYGLVAGCVVGSAAAIHYLRQRKQYASLA